MEGKKSGEEGRREMEGGEGSDERASTSFDLIQPDIFRSFGATSSIEIRGAELSI